jgi:hypothetical protein
MNKVSEQILSDIKNMPELKGSKPRIKYAKQIRENFTNEISLRHKIDDVSFPDTIYQDKRIEMINSIFFLYNPRDDFKIETDEEIIEAERYILNKELVNWWIEREHKSPFEIIAKSLLKINSLSYLLDNMPVLQGNNSEIKMANRDRENFITTLINYRRKTIMKGDRNLLLKHVNSMFILFVEKYDLEEDYEIDDFALIIKAKKEILEETSAQWWIANRSNSIFEIIAETILKMLFR